MSKRRWLPALVCSMVAAAGATEAMAAPLWVFREYPPSGWMGDGERGTEFLLFEWRKGTDCPCAEPVAHIRYETGPQGWAGIYWLHDWGWTPGRDLRGYACITWYAKGARGGEIVEFISGGVQHPGAPYSDPYRASTGPVILENRWKKYILSLRGHDLSSVVGAFAWVAQGPANNDELEFWLGSVRFEDDASACGSG